MGAPFYWPRNLDSMVVGRCVQTQPALMVNGTTVFVVRGSPIKIMDLVSYCTAANDTTASTLQWSADGDVGAATTFTGATSTLASFAAGGIVYNTFVALTTAPVVTQTAGVALAGSSSIYVPPGIITMVIGVGSTTGLWQHFMRFTPMGLNCTVTPAF